MATVLVRNHLTPEELRQLQDEFPQFSYHIEESQGEPTKEQWTQVEILFGDHLRAEEFAGAPLLRWIHVTHPGLEELCLKELQEGGTLLITNTKDEDTHQIGEFALAAILGFAKKICDWRGEEQEPGALWSSPIKSQMQMIHDQTLLQIGLGRVGSRIAHLCREFGMRTWGISDKATFHPECDKAFMAKDLHSLLPNADVVSMAVPRGEKAPARLERAQLKLMKEGSTLLVLGSGGMVDEGALAELAPKFGGVLLDVFEQSPLPRSSPLWGLPNVTLTPEIASYPKSGIDQAYRTFRHNLRCFLHDDFDRMKNLVQEIS